MSNLQGPPLQDEGVLPLTEAARNRDAATGLDGGLEEVDLQHRSIQTSSVPRRRKKYFQPPEVPNLNLDISEVKEHQHERRASGSSPPQSKR
jgi:hypothetical protein